MALCIEVLKPGMSKCVQHCCVLTVNTMGQDFEHTLCKFNVIEVYVSVNCASVKLYSYSVIIYGSRITCIEIFQGRLSFASCLELLSL